MRASKLAIKIRVGDVIDYYQDPPGAVVREVRHETVRIGLVRVRIVDNGGVEKWLDYEQYERVEVLPR